MRDNVVILSTVARGRYEQMVAIPRRLDRIINRLRVASPTVAVIADTRTHPDRIVDSANDRVAGEAAIGARRLQGHYLDFPVDPRDANTVVAYTTNSAGTMSAVTVVVHGIAVVIEEVVAVHIVDQTIVVVVNAVVGDFPGIRPHVSGKILVAIVDARINHRHHNIDRAGRPVPRFHSINIGIKCPAVLPGVLHPPQLIEARI